MIETLTNEEKIRALENAIPREPQIYELGGDIYYKCHWVKCGETLHKWMRYCPRCGNRIDWGCIDGFLE